MDRFVIEHRTEICDDPKTCQLEYHCVLKDNVTHHDLYPFPSIDQEMLRTLNFIAECISRGGIVHVDT